MTQTFDEESLWARVVKKDEAIASCVDIVDPWEQAVKCNVALPRSKKEGYAIRHIIDVFLANRLLINQGHLSREELLEKRVKLLEAKVNELEGKTESPIKLPTKADLIYEKYREDLEYSNMGKIVAIDSKMEKVVGIGDSILEAYENALGKSTGKQFTFRKVGCNYIHRI